MSEQQTIKYAPQWTNMTVDNVIFQTNNVSTDVSFDPFPSTDEPEKLPLKEFLIKFSVSNGQRPLTFDFKIFCSSTVLDYNNDKNVDHPTPKVLGENYSSTEQVNSIQQLLAYSLITRTENPSKVTDIELTAHMIAINNRRDSVSPPPLVAKPKKGKSQTVALTLPKSQGPEASGALSKKRKKPMSKRPPTTTKESPPKPTEGSEVTWGQRLRGNIPPADMEPIHTPVADPSGTGAKYQVDETQSTRLRYRSLTKNKGKTSSEVEPDTEPLKLQTYADIQAFLLSDDELDKDSDEEEVLAAGDDMDEDPQDDKEVRTPSPKQDQPEPSHV
ncbi:hypothetical protein Tco_1383557 [Tanacetum coccineum]